MKARLKRSELDIILSKENLKQKLKDRFRVRGCCFSNTKYKKEFDSINAQNMKKEIKQDHFSYNKKLKQLIANFKSIKNNIILIEQKDKENKRIINNSKLLTDNSRISYNNLYDKVFTLNKRFDRAKKINKQYILQKSKLNLEKKSYILDEELSEYKMNNINNKDSNKDYNILDKSHLNKKINEEYYNEIIKHYNDFFSILYKRNKSAKIIKNSQIKSKNIFDNILPNKKKYLSCEKNDSNTLSYELLNKNNDININFNYSINNSSDIDKNTIDNEKTFKNHEKLLNLKSFSNKHINYKNKLIKNINNESNNIFKCDKSSKHISTELNSNFNKTNSNLFYSKSSKQNILLKIFKNINSNKINYNPINNTNFYNQNENKHKKNFHINKKYSSNNLNPLSKITTFSKTNNAYNYNTISNCNNIYKDKIKNIKVIYKPIYTAKIVDFVKNYNRIKNKNKINKIKRKENHLFKYADIEKAFEIKEDMMMFLLKDKYIQSQFPKTYIKKPDKRKLFLKKFNEKLQILENPYNKDLKSETIN